MNIIPSTEHHYENDKEALMKRLADASQYKIYPTIIPRIELPLRKILLTTRLWNHVRRQQAMLTIATEDWLFDKQQDIPTKEPQCDWSWLDNQVEEDQEQEGKKRTRTSEEEEDEDESYNFKKAKPNLASNFHHFPAIDSPASPAGPASSATSPSPSPTPAVLLSV